MRITFDVTPDMEIAAGCHYLGLNYPNAVFPEEIIDTVWDIGKDDIESHLSFLLTHRGLEGIDELIDEYRNTTQWKVIGLMIS